MRTVLPLLIFSILALLAGNPGGTKKQGNPGKGFTGHQIILYLADQKGVLDYE